MSVTTVDLPDNLKDQIKNIAAAEHRSMNATIVVALEQYAETHGRRARIRAIGRRIVDEQSEILDRLAQ